MHAGDRAVNRSHFEELDASDPLARLREQFVLPDGVTYLDGNSLGALPRGVAERVQQLIESEWADDLIRSWTVHSWVDLPRRVGDRIGGLVGAEPGSVICGDTTSVNLYKAVGAAISLADGDRILTDSGNFPTDVYVHIVPHKFETHATGVGEPGTPPIAPAIANGIFNATGKRIRHIPIRPEDIRDA